MKNVFKRTAYEKLWGVELEHFNPKYAIDAFHRQVKDTDQG
jgi:hypothetical protein